MISGVRLLCPRCGFSSKEYHPFCPRCGSPLELEGELGAYRRVMGEGNTPIIEVEWGNGLSLYFKLEYLNPTGSFKDRGVAVSLLIARELGYDCVVEDSSGNTGISVAAYSARLGLKSKIVVPVGASESKKSLIKLLGADLIEEADRASAAVRAGLLMKDCFYVSHATSPIFIEGTSSVGSEIIESVGASIPILLPVSSGTLLLGVYRAFKRRGLEPRIIAVQASEYTSLRHRTRLLAEVGGRGSKLADALVYRDPPRLDEMAKAVEGLVIVGDNAIKHALLDLYTMGFIVEPSSAVVWAAYKELNRRGIVDEAVLVLTGSGLKYVGEITGMLRRDYK